MKAIKIAALILVMAVASVSYAGPPGTAPVGPNTDLTVGSLSVGTSILSSTGDTLKSDRPISSAYQNISTGPIIKMGAAINNVIISDDFTDSDTTAIASHTMDNGDGWTVASGAGEISSNALIADAPNTYVRINADAFSYDVDVSATITFGATENAHLLARYVDANNNTRVYVTSTGYIRVDKIVGGSATLSAQTGISPAPSTAESYTLRLMCFGPWVIGTMRDSTVQIYDANYASGSSTKVGITLNAADWVADDFEAVPITSMPTLPAYPSSVSVSHAATYLTIPSYDSSGQAMHPSIIYNASGWNGYKYWLATSPYTDTNNQYENPQIHASNDGDTWVVPSGLTNPIDAWPGVVNQYNADPEIVIGPDDVMYCFYIEVEDTDDHIYLRYRTSSNGTTWTSEKTLMAVPYNGAISPSVIWDGEWKLWIGNKNNHNYSDFLLLKADSIEDLKTAIPIKCFFSGLPYPATGSSAERWHYDVIRDGEKYVAIVMAKETDDLWLAYSYDGIYWITSDSAILSPGGAGTWYENTLYRATLLPISGGYDLFYSAQNAANEWYTGRTTINITE